MFFRYEKDGRRRVVDLGNLFEGQKAIILGSSPSLKSEDIEQLKKPGLLILAINNAPEAFKSYFIEPTLWVGGDRPKCYSERILTNPKIMKFGIISARDEMVVGRAWKDWPSTYFFGVTDKFTNESFLHRSRDYVWWKNTLYIALQMIWRFGVRTVYLAGVSLKVGKDCQYAYDYSLTDEQINWNKRTYENAVQKLGELRSVFGKFGYNVVSATRESALNEFLPKVSLERAVEDCLDSVVSEVDTSELVHSSFYRV